MVNGELQSPDSQFRTTAKGFAAENRLKPAISQVDELVNQRLTEVLSRSHSLILDFSNYTFFISGKKIRPRFLFALAGMKGAFDEESATDCGAICELLHSATLIHDDIIDGSEMRRGHRSVNSLFGNDVAVIVGDYVLTQALKLVVKQDDSYINRIFVEASEELALGVLSEIVNKNNFNMTEEDYLKVIYLKTGALFKLAGRMGAWVAGFNPEQIEVAGRYGELFGLAFQIIDDLLDIASDPAQSGKPRFSDIREGRVTLPIIFALRTAAENGPEKADTLGHHLSAEEIRERVVLYQEESYPVGEKTTDSSDSEASAVPPQSVPNGQSLIEKELLRCMIETGALDYAHKRALSLLGRASQVLLEIDKLGRKRGRGRSTRLRVEELHNLEAALRESAEVEVGSA